MNVRNRATKRFPSRAAAACAGLWVIATVGWLTTGRFESLFALSLLLTVFLVGIDYVLNPGRPLGFKEPSANVFLGVLVVAFLFLLIVVGVWSKLTDA